MATPLPLTGDWSVRKLISADLIDEPVKRFLTALSISPEPSVVEVNGRQLFILVRSATNEPNARGPWSVEKNQRRHALIDRQVDGTISMEEALELAELNAAMDHWIDTVAPLPLDHARKIHDALVAKTLAKTPAGSTDQ